MPDTGAAMFDEDLHRICFVKRTTFIQPWSHQSARTYRFLVVSCPAGWSIRINGKQER